MPDTSADMISLHTDRLRLTAATPAMLKAELSDGVHLAELLEADVPAGWPPDLLDEAAVQYTLDKTEQGPEQVGWWMWFVILTEHHQHTLIGGAGYKGPPDEQGSVEIGYGIVPEFQRHGYGTEAAKALIRRAFDDDAIKLVIAETLPELEASIKVMNKCGMSFLGEGEEQGEIRYGVTREAWSTFIDR